MKKKIMITVALLMLGVVFVNVKVVLGKNDPLNISVSLTKSALADGEDPPEDLTHWVCGRCIDHYGQPQIYYSCITMDHYDCFFYPCSYGVC
jgi:hypothetical protein